MTITCKADVDRIRQRVGSARAKLRKIEDIIREYAKGASPAQSMLQIIRVMKGAK